MLEYYECIKCKRECDTQFALLLHYWTEHEHCDRGITPYESNHMLSYCGVFTGAFWRLVQQGINSPNWPRRN